MEELPNWISVHGLYLLIISGFLLGLACALYAVVLARRWLGGRNRIRGFRAEKRAIKLLQKQGFRVLERDPSYRSELLVDGQLTAFEITPDLLVERDGQQYVVEIKHYRHRVSIQTASVRRQVLEYLWATDLPCLLITMPEGNIEQICLQDRSDPRLDDDT